MCWVKIFLGIFKGGLENLYIYALLKFISCIQYQIYWMSSKPQPRQRDDNSAKLPQTLKDGRKAIDELKLLYNKENNKDVNWLASILGELIRFPSQDLADRHRKANKLGTKDVKTKQQIARELGEEVQDEDYSEDGDLKYMSSKQQAADQRSKQKNAMKRCKCCGLLEQDELLKVSTDVEHVNHIGMSTSLYFMTLKNLSTLLLVMLIAFSIFAVATNYRSSELYRNSQQGLTDIDEKNVTYHGILAISLGSKLYYQSDFTELTFAAQCWLGTITVLIWTFAFIYIKKVQKEFQYRVDYETTSARDFTVLASHIPIRYYNQNLTQLFQEKLTKYVQDTKKVIPNYRQIFGKVDEPIRVNSVNRISVINLQKYYNEDQDHDDKELKKYQELIKQLDQRWLEIIENRRKSAQFDLPFQDLQKLQIQYLELKRRKLHRHMILSKQKHEEKMQKNQDTNKFSTFSAFIIFEHTENKELIERLHERQKSLIHKFPCFDRRQYLELPGERYSNVEIQIEPSPEPEDVIWANSSMTACQRYFIQVITFAVTIGAIALSFLFVFLLSQVQAVVKDSQRKHAGLIVSVLSGAISLILFAVNYLLTIIINFLTKLQRNITYTREQTSIGVKSIIAVLLNSIVVPFVVNKIIKDNLYGSDGLADVIFYQALTSALLTPLMKIVNPGYIFYLVKRWWYNRPNSRLYLSQKELNKLNEEPEFEIGTEYVSIVSMFLFACFYASLQPIIVPIAAFGMFLMRNAQKLCLYWMRKRPTPGESDINTSMYYFIFAGPLFYSVGSLFFANIFTEFKHGIIPNGLSIIASLFVLMAPYQEITRFLMRSNKKIRSSTYTQDRVFLVTDYGRSNPQTKQSAQNEYRIHVQQYLKNMKRHNYKIINSEQRQINSMHSHAIRQLQQRPEPMPIAPEIDSHEPYIKILINNSNPNIMLSQMQQLDRYLDHKVRDQFLRKIPYYVDFGDFDNQEIVIQEMNLEDLRTELGGEVRRAAEYNTGGYDQSIDYEEMKRQERRMKERIENERREELRRWQEQRREMQKKQDEKRYWQKKKRQEEMQGRQMQRRQIQRRQVQRREINRKQELKKQDQRRQMQKREDQRRYWQRKKRQEEIRQQEKQKK